MINIIIGDENDFNLMEISDQAEWDAVNKTIMATLESLGEA